MVFSSEMMQTSMRDLCYIVFRHKWKIAACFVVIVAAVTAYTYLSREMYRSEARILVRMGRANMSVDSSVEAPSMPVLRNQDAEVKSELAILTSRALVEKLVDVVGPARILGESDEVPAGAGWREKLRVVRRAVRGVQHLAESTLIRLDIISALTPREKAIKRVMKGLTVNVEKNSNVVSVSYDAGWPEIAQMTLAGVIEYYQDLHVQVYASQASPAFFEQQTSALQQQLADREKALDTFRTQNGIVTMNEQKETLLNQISALDTQMEDATANFTAAQAQLNSYEAARKGRSPVLEISRSSGHTNYAADAWKERLADLRLKENDLTSKYPDTWRPLVELREKIKEAEAQLAKEGDTHTEITTGLDMNYQQLQKNLDDTRAQVSSYEAKKTVIADALAKQKDQLALLATKEAELKRLERDVTISEQEYKQYRENMQRSLISAALDKDKVSNVSVIQPASLPMDPFTPRKALNIGLGVLMGLFGGVLFAFAIEYFDETLNTPEKVQNKLGMGTLMVISDKEFKACT